MRQMVDMPFRVSFAAIASVGITFCLLFLMQLLIATGKTPETENSIGKILDFVRLIRDVPPQVKDRKIEKPPALEQPPQDMPRPPMENPGSVGKGIHIPAVPLNPDININNKIGLISDGEYLPVFKVAPTYPRQAQRRGLEGYVMIEFTVTKTGAVTNPVVVKAEPLNVFDRAALAAVLKFKYKPRVVNGEPIDVPGVQNLIRFELTD